MTILNYWNNTFNEADVAEEGLDKLSESKQLKLGWLELELSTTHRLTVYLVHLMSNSHQRLILEARIGVKRGEDAAKKIILQKRLMTISWCATKFQLLRSPRRVTLQNLTFYIIGSLGWDYYDDGRPVSNCSRHCLCHYHKQKHRMFTVSISTFVNDFRSPPILFRSPFIPVFCLLEIN